MLIDEQMHALGCEHIEFSFSTSHQVLISNNKKTTGVILKKLEEIKWAQNVQRFVRNWREANGKPNSHGWYRGQRGKEQQRTSA